jgi:ribosomal protein L7Ae-like RNA K-turn-binding protein
MRAKKLTFGFDTVKEAVKAGSVYLLLTASDLSDKTVKEVRFLGEKMGIPVLPLDKTQEEMRFVIGKFTGVLAITDEGLARSLISKQSTP